jgi:hypothetical protein
MALVAVSAGCQHADQLSISDNDIPVAWTTAGWISGVRGLYRVPADADAETSREALFRLASALDASYAALDFAPPYPSIRIIEPKHALMSNSRIGLAIVTDTGEERIYINRDYLERRSDIDALILHEIAHLQAWRVNGRNIAPHGRAYQIICRAVLPRRGCERFEF